MGLFGTKCTNNIDLANRLKSVASIVLATIFMW